MLNKVLAFKGQNWDQVETTAKHMVLTMVREEIDVMSLLMRNRLEISPENSQLRWMIV